jgi:hypothetical protein
LTGLPQLGRSPQKAPGNFAIFTAILRASSLLSQLGGGAAARLILEIDIRQLLPIAVGHDKAGL